MTSRSRLAAWGSACVLLVTLAAATVAGAAAAPAPEAGGDLDLQTWSESGQLIVVTSVTVPESVKLPTVVRIPVPDGAAVQWAGEILGGELSADPARPYKMIKSPVGGQYAEFTLEQTRSAQVDSSMAVVKVEGDVTSAAFEWVQSASSPLTSFSVRVPANASDPQITPRPSGQPDTNAAGERLYSGDPVKLKPGQKQQVSFSYSTGAAAPAQAAGSSLDALIGVLAAALGLALIVLVVVIVRQRRGSANAVPSPGTSRRAPRDEGPVQAPRADSTPEDGYGFDDVD
jgi:hypothetical protein